MADGKARTISAILRAFGTFAWRSQSISSLLSTEHKSDNSESETFFSLSNPSEISDRFLLLSVRLDKNVCSYEEAIKIRKQHNFCPLSYLGFSFRKLQIPVSQTTDSHFANYRFSFRKLQILISQTTDFHFANYRFPFRFVPFRFANYSKPLFGANHMNVLKADPLIYLI